MSEAINPAPIEDEKNPPELPLRPIEQRERLYNVPNQGEPTAELSVVDLDKLTETQLKMLYRGGYHRDISIFEPGWKMYSTLELPTDPQAEVAFYREHPYEDLQIMLAITPEETQRILNEQNPHNFELDILPTDDTMLGEWFRWKHNISADSPSYLTDEQICEAFDALNSILEYPEKQDIYIFLSYTHEPEKRKELLERLRSDSEEKKPGKLSEEEVRKIKQAAEKYLSEKGDFRGLALEIGLDNLQASIGSLFDGHGIRSITTLHAVDSLNYLLTYGVDKDRPFHTMSLSVPDEDKSAIYAIGATKPFTDGGFIVVGPPPESGKPVLISNKGIKIVLVDEQYYESIQLLQKRFPDITFIRADEVEQGLKELLIN